MPEGTAHVGPAPPRVDFYVLSGAVEGARLRLACRIAEKAYLSGVRVALLCPDETVLRALDELLWTFSDGSFVPHERLGDAAPDGPGADCPVVLADPASAPPPAEVVINLCAQVPPAWSGVQRIAEILDADPERRAAGRARFRHYRAAGIEPHTHNLES